MSKENVQEEGYNFPDKDGHFGPVKGNVFGGKYVSETLMPLINEVAEAYEVAKNSPEFADDFAYYCKHYIGRPSPLYFASRLTEHCGGAKIYFKRDELNHTGAHKINNCIGQILLAKAMGKTRIIAETGAGQHGVATATVCALFDLPCIVFMGAKDMERQKPNVFRMKLLGAEIVPVESGTGTLKDAMNEAMRDWVANVHNTYYLIGSAAGPHPFPAMVRDFQSIIGIEAREQILEAEGRLPDMLVAAVGGGSNAIGLFHPFLADLDTQLVAVEAAGKGLRTDQHAATMTKGEPGVLHGSKSFVLQDEDGQIKPTYSISAGLDYPGIGPEHAFLHQHDRIKFTSATDEEALRGFSTCSKLEGIIPALEPAHAIGYLLKHAKQMDKEQIIIMNLCGRGDKDIFTAAAALGIDMGGDNA